MSRMTPHYPERVYSTGEEERQRSLLERYRPGAVSTGWLLTGLTAVGLGLLAWRYFGPDLRRYIKISRM